MNDFIEYYIVNFKLQYYNMSEQGSPKRAISFKVVHQLRAIESQFCGFWVKKPLFGDLKSPKYRPLGGGKNGSKEQKYIFLDT